MMTMEKAQKTLEAVFGGSQSNCRMRRTVIAGLLLAGSATATLDKYLTNPRAMVPDTSMVYAGLKDDAERADLVAYLATLH